MASKLSKEVIERLNEFKKQITSTASMVEIGKQLSTDIVKRTKLGYGVDTPNGTQSKLKPLSGPYKKQRKSIPLDSSTSPTKSNLTQTGKMLNDLGVKSSSGKVTIDLKSAESVNKAKWNQDKGRTFMNVSKTQVSKLVTLIRKKIKEILGN